MSRTASPDGDGPTGRIGVLLGGRYLLGELLGVGSSAAVYAADDLSPEAQRRFAIKVLHPHLCATARLREAFLREAAHAARLRHPNIVAVHGSGLHDAGGVIVAWIAFDLVSGPTLATWLRSRGPLPPADAAAVLDGLLAALGAAHAAGLVHRDVAPRNIVLEGADPARSTSLSAGMVRLLDFGLADRPGRTTVGGDVLLADVADARTVIGDVAFLSPEQASGAPVTASGDLYQAGGVLYHVLTGQVPFPRRSAAEVLAAHLVAPPPVPSALVPAARPYDPVVTTAMDKDPARRYRDAGAFQTALAAAASHGGSGGAPSATRVLPLGGIARTSRPSTPRAPVDRGRTAPAATARAADPWEFPEPSGWNPVVLGAAATVAVVAIAAVLGSAPTRGATGTPSAPPPATATPTPTPSRTPVERVVVPDLSGALSVAADALRSRGLELGTVTRATSPQPAGTVLHQSPKAGSRARAGTPVDLVVASGRNRVPDVTGLTVATALATLRAAGFTGVADSTDAADTALVTGSVPDAEAQASVGTTVVLVVERFDPSPTPSDSAPSATPAPQVP